jgi:protein-disulfide isomerase
VRLGAARGAPTLIEFADLQCPVCARYDIEVMRSVVDRYIRPGKVNYELRVHAILGPDSVRAAGAAAAAADQDRLYPFTDLFYREQGSENSGYVTDGFLRRLASAIPGLNPDAVVRAANAPTRQPLFQEATRLAQALGSSSTPDFYLKLAGGRLVRVSPSALTPGAFAQALDAALAQKT